jgi:hypothetical protein
MRLVLKKLAEANLEHACEKAEKYRDLNQPDEAESICRDVLDVSPEHQAALKTLGLALTDQYPGGWRRVHKDALFTFSKLTSEYERVYYTGIAWERCAKAQLEEGGGRAAFDAFHKALELFERAEGLAPRGEPDAILRWNRCVRALTTHPLLLAAADAPAPSHIDYGDDAPGG